MNVKVRQKATLCVFTSGKRLYDSCRQRGVRFTNKSAAEVVEATEVLTQVLKIYADGVGMFIGR